MIDSHAGYYRSTVKPNNGGNGHGNIVVTDLNDVTTTTVPMTTTEITTTMEATTTVETTTGNLLFETFLRVKELRYDQLKYKQHFIWIE